MKEFKEERETFIFHYGLFVFAFIYYLYYLFFLKFCLVFLFLFIFPKSLPH